LPLRQDGRWRQLPLPDLRRRRRLHRLHMQFVKKHYEKVLLSIVLLGLAGAAAALPWQVSHERDRLEEIQGNLTVKVKAKPFKPLDAWLTTNKTVLARLESPLNLEFSGQHNLFNPVPWKKMPDVRIFPVLS